MAPLRRASIGLDLCGACSLLAWCALTYWSRRGAVPAAALIAVMGVGWASLALAWRAARRESGARLLPRLWLWAVLFRAAGFVGAPVLEDDHYRYLWDGYRFATAGTPYGSAPARFFEDASVPPRFQTILDGINHPHLETIYGPVTEWAFRVAYAVAPGELWAWKAIAIGADLGALALLLRLVAPANALLYAWCPLLIQEIAFTGHPESLGALALMAGLVLFRRGNRAGAGAAVVAAAGVKITGGLLLPFVLWRPRWRVWLAVASVGALLWGPFWWRGATEWSSLRAMAAEWEFNSSVFGLAAAALGRGWAQGLCGMAMASGFLWIWKRWSPQEIPRGDWLYGGFFLLSPVVNPWYLLWLVPFAALYPSVWAMAAPAAVSLSYWCGVNSGVGGLGAYEHPVWVRVVEYGVIACAVAWAARERTA
ncbi:MAG: glycosyltransferase 87 family protein [Bryobacteraceae bacterium]